MKKPFETKPLYDEKNTKVMSIKDFNLESKTFSGGVTGSSCVKGAQGTDFENLSFQLKPSILDNTLLRKMKAFYTDRENFGEVIASYLGKAFIGGQNVPTVSLVYDKKNKRILVASKYLTGNDVATLDDYAKKVLRVEKPSQKHFQFVANDDHVKDKNYQCSLLHPDIKDLWQSLAEAIAVSAMVGDHDVNPGNMLVVSQSNQKYVARIDFGHAFYDLLNAPKKFGGGIRDKNAIRDFFNRNNVGGITMQKHGKIGDQSKLWRDYPGIVHSNEMCDALFKLSRVTDETINEAVDVAKRHFHGLLMELLDNDDQASINHLNKTLLAIGNNIGRVFTFNPQVKELLVNMQIINTNKGVGATINRVFDLVRIMAIANRNQMKVTATILKVQCLVEEYYNSKNPKKIEVAKKLIDNLFKMYPNRSVTSKIKWIKLGGQKLPFLGTFDQYLSLRVSFKYRQECKQFINFFNANILQEYKGAIPKGLLKIRKLLEHANINLNTFEEQHFINLFASIKKIASSSLEEGDANKPQNFFQPGSPSIDLKKIYTIMAAKKISNFYTMQKKLEEHILESQLIEQQSPTNDDDNYSLDDDYEKFDF